MGWRWKRDWRKSDPSLLARRRRRRISAEAPDTARDVKIHTVHAAFFTLDFFKKYFPRWLYSPSSLAFSIVFRNWPCFFTLPTILAKLLCHLYLLLDGNWDLLLNTSLGMARHLPVEWLVVRTLSHSIKAALSQPLKPKLALMAPTLHIAR